MGKLLGTEAVSLWITDLGDLQQGKLLLLGPHWQVFLLCSGHSWKIKYWLEGNTFSSKAIFVLYSRPAMSVDSEPTNLSNHGFQTHRGGSHLASLNSTGAGSQNALSGQKTSLWLEAGSSGVFGPLRPFWGPQKPWVVAFSLFRPQKSLWRWRELGCPCLPRL